MQTNENPVDYLIRRCGLTRIAFTRDFGFGENHLLLISQGRKESVGKKLVSALYRATDIHGIDLEKELLQQYATDDLNMAFWGWRTRMREQAKLPVKVENGIGSPMARLVRWHGSIAQTAKNLRVRDINVRRYMDSQVMPQPIFDALCETPWGRNGAVALGDAQVRYFKDKGRKR